MGKRAVKLTDDEIIMQDSPNMRAAGTREALSRKKQAADRNITPAMKGDEKKRDAKVIELCRTKAKATGQPETTFAAGYETYVDGLIDFVCMSKLERYQWGKAQAFPSVASPSEILAAL